MKLIKAFIRTDRVDEVVRALEDAACPGITVSRVHGVGYGYEPMLFTLAPGELKRAPQVSKIEVVCRDVDVERFLQVLVGAAKTGAPGDGIVFVTPVDRAIKIRTGVRDQLALVSAGPKEP